MAKAVCDWPMCGCPGHQPPCDAGLIPDEIKPGAEPGPGR
jgi:hypothetical protein